MIKLRLYLLTILSCYSLIASAQKSAVFDMYLYIWKWDSLKYISSYMVTESFVDSATHTPELDERNSYELNTQGKQTSAISYNKESDSLGRFWLKRCYAYDAYGNVTLETWFHNGDTSRIESATNYSYEYDAKHRVVQRKQLYHEKWHLPHDSSLYKYVYDSKGNQVIEALWVNGEWSNTHYYTYNNQNQLVKTVNRATNHKESDTYTYKGDKLTQVKHSRKGFMGCSFDPDKKVYEYDSLGRLKTRWEYYGRSLRNGLFVYRIEHTYTGTHKEPDTIIVFITNSALTETSRNLWYYAEVYEYNEHRLPVKKTEYSRHNKGYYKVFTMDYEFR